MSNVKNLKKLREGLVLLSRDRQVVYSFHETFEMVDEMLELVDQLIEKEQSFATKKPKMFCVSILTTS